MATKKYLEKKEKKLEPKQSPEAEKKVNKSLTKQESKTDSTVLKEDVLTHEQLKEKEELEKDLEQGIKVSEAVGKRSTRLDTIDKWLTVLPFVGDAFTSSANLLFFIIQNQRLSKKYRLPLGDKIKAALLQAGDRTFETLLKAPINSIQSIPILGRLTRPITQPLKVTIGWFSDSIFKANKRTAKLFTDNFEKMLADAKKRNKENPDKEQIDVQGLQSEIEENMQKITNKLKVKE